MKNAGERPVYHMFRKRCNKREIVLIKQMRLRGLDFSISTKIWLKLNQIYHKQFSNGKVN